MTRTSLQKSPIWENNFPTDGKDFYFIPRVYLLRQGPQFTNSEIQWSQACGSDIVDLDISMTPLYVAEGQQVTMKIVNGKLDIQVSKQQ